MLGWILSPLEVAEELRRRYRSFFPTLLETERWERQPHLTDHGFEPPHGVSRALAFYRGRDSLAGIVDRFDEVCPHEGGSPSGSRKHRGTRRVLVRWVREARPMSLRRRRFLILVNPLAYFRPTYENAVRRHLEAQQRGAVPLLSASVRETLLLIKANTPNLAKPDFEASLDFVRNKLNYWLYDEFRQQFQGSIERILRRFVHEAELAKANQRRMDGEVKLSVS